MTFRDLKVGDRVTRMVGDNKKFMDMVVVRVRDQHLWCSACPSDAPITEQDIEKFEAASDDQVAALWKFDRDVGCEEDADLGWGKEYGATGTFLGKIKQDE